MNQPLRIMYRAGAGKLGRARVSGKTCRRSRISSEQFRDARVYAGLTREQAADLVGVSLRTVGHWETDGSRPAYAAFKLLRVFRHGDLLHPAWKGYSIVRGRLVTPEGHCFLPHEMVWQSLLVRMAHQFRLASRERAGLPSVLTALGSGALARSAGEAGGALGLSIYSTKGKRVSPPSCAATDSRDFMGPDVGPTVGPQLPGVEDGRSTEAQAQPAADRITAAARPGNGRQGAGVSEHAARLRRRKLPSVPGAVLAGSRTQTGPRSAGTGQGSAHGSSSQGRRESALSLRKRREVQALPREAGDAVMFNRELTSAVTRGDADTSPAKAIGRAHTGTDAPPVLSRRSAALRRAGGVL